MVRVSRRAGRAALALVVLTLLFALPASAAPPRNAGGATAGFLTDLWHGVLDVLGILAPAESTEGGPSMDPGGLAAPTDEDAGPSMDPAG